MKLQSLLHKTAFIALTIGCAKAQLVAQGATGSSSHHRTRGHRPVRTSRNSNSTARRTNSSVSGDKHYLLNDAPYVGPDNKGLDIGVMINNTRASDQKDASLGSSSNARLEAANQIRISLSDGKSKDQTVVYFGNGGTLGFDGDLDAMKLGSSTFAIYSGVKDKLAINCVTSVEGESMLPITMVVKATGQFMLSFPENTTADETLFIWDKKYDKYIDMHQGLSELVYLDLGVNANRFYMVSSTQDNNLYVTGTESYVGNTSNTGIYPNPYAKGALSMTLENAFAGEVKIEIMDGHNSVVKEFAASGISKGASTVIDLSSNVEDLPVGNYFIRCVGGSSFAQKKLMIVN